LLAQPLVGQEVDVLVEGPSEETDLLWQARMSTQAPEIDGICYINDFGPSAPRSGEMRRIRITEAHDYDLVGELMDSGETGWKPAPVKGLIQIMPLDRPQTAPLAR